MSYDHGFDLPDVRYEYIDKEGVTIKVEIVRHWYQPDDEQADTQFKVSFNLYRKGRLESSLPIGVTESKAIEVAKVLWEEDEEESRQIQEMRAEEEAERKMGA